MNLSLPVVHIEAENLAEGWEKAVLECWERGARIPTQYDRPDDPPSRDVSLFLAVADPYAEPRIHRAMPGGFQDLEVYRQEVVDGIHDHWIAPEEGKWQYSYHERIAVYRVPGMPEPINQLDYVVETLCATPYSRRAQCVLWKAWEDGQCEHPACLQRLWFRIFDDRLLMSANMRSNDAFKAAYMNMYAFTDLQRTVAERISERLGREIKVGQYNHIVDSFHIYGSYFKDFEGFLKTVETRTFEQRTYHTADVQMFIDEAKVAIAATLEKERDKREGPICEVFDANGKLLEMRKGLRLYTVALDVTIWAQSLYPDAYAEKQEDGSVEVRLRPDEADEALGRDKPVLLYRIVPIQK